MIERGEPLPARLRAAGLSLRHAVGLRFRKRILSPLCQRLLVDDDRAVKRTILVAGAPRSGTTWLAEVLESSLHGRLMFEPFRPDFVPAFRHIMPFHYARPDTADDALHAGCLSVFDGSLRNPWVDKNVTTLRPRCRIVKSIRSNHMLAWIRRNFPDVSILFLMRHPCAVVLSRMHYGWKADDDLAAMLEQPALVADHLVPWLDRIGRATTDEEKHAIIWCINHLVPLRDVGAAGLMPLHYEHLYQGRHDLSSTLASRLAAFGDLRISDGLRPSRTTTRNSPVRRGGDNLAYWQKVLPRQAIRRILDTTAAFGLDVYGDAPLPLRPIGINASPARAGVTP